MLDQLRSIVEISIQRPLDIGSLRRFGTDITDPQQALSMATEFARLAARCLPPQPHGLSHARRDGLDLIRFVADLPEWIKREVRETPCFPQQGRAWDEPSAGAYVGVCATVQDVWEHLFGPEAAEDLHLEAALLAEQTGRVLDFGCGAGHFSMVLARNGIAVGCYDINTVKRAFLQARAGWNEVDGLISVGEPQPPYDTILALNVLDHLLDPGTAAAELVRWLQPGGRLFVSADFPHDQWHQSGDDAIDRTAAALFDGLVPEAKAIQGCRMDILRRSSKLAPAPDRVSAAERCDVRPRLHPTARFLREHRGSDEEILVGERFYLRPHKMDRLSHSIISRCDGRSTVAELAAIGGITVDETWELIEFLWREHWLVVS